MNDKELTPRSRHGPWYRRFKPLYFDKRQKHASKDQIQAGAYLNVFIKVRMETQGLLFVRQVSGAIIHEGVTRGEGVITNEKKEKVSLLDKEFSSISSSTHFSY